MKRNRWILILFFVGVLIGPMIDFVLAGLATSSHKTGSFVYDAPTPSIEDTRRLINAYSHSHPLPWRSPWAADEDFSKIFGDADCGYDKNEADELLAASWQINLVQDVAARADEVERGMLVGEIEKDTSAFERGFLAECLNGVIYGGVCRAASQSLFDRALKKVSDNFREKRTLIYHDAANLKCHVYDGVIARKKDSTALPKQ